MNRPKYIGLPEGEVALHLAKLLRRAVLPTVSGGFESCVRVVVRRVKGGGFRARVECRVNRSRVETFDGLVSAREPTREAALAGLARLVVLRSLDPRMSGIGAAIDELSRRRNYGYRLRSCIGLAMAGVCPGVDLIPEEASDA